MEYKNIIKDGINYHLINTKRFKQISIVLFLTAPFNKVDRAYANLLIGNLIYSSKKYNTRSKMSSYMEELYGAKIVGNYSLTGASEAYTFHLEFVNPKYTKKDYLEKTIDFYSEILFNPNVSDGKFYEEYFNTMKTDLINSIKSIKDNPNAYSNLEYNHLMYEGTVSGQGNVPDVEDVEKITSKDLYDYYKKLFENKFKVDVFVLGEVEDSIIDLLHNKFNNIKSNNSKIELTINHKYDKKLKEKQETLKFNQSKLFMGYRLNNMNYHELNHVLRVYNTILGTMNDSILFNVVREANSLCYSIGSYTSKYNPSLTIYAGINKENYKKTVELIKKCVSDMSDKKTVERLFDSAKKTLNTYLNDYYDNVYSQINHYYTNVFEENEDIEVLRESLNNVTIDEVINLNKKIRLSTIYLLKGDQNE